MSEKLYTKEELEDEGGEFVEFRTGIKTGGNGKRIKDVFFREPDAGDMEAVSKDINARKNEIKQSLLIFQLCLYVESSEGSEQFRRVTVLERNTLKASDMKRLNDCLGGWGLNENSPLAE